MKNYRKYYAIIWAILFAVYNAVVFLVFPNDAFGLNKFGGAFWASYVAIIIAFIGNLICSLRFFESGNKEQTFLSMPLLTIAWSALAVTMLVGTLAMLIVDLPNWIAALICLVILALYAIALVKAAAAKEAVAEAGNRMKENTASFRLLIAEAESAMNSAADGEIKAEAKKIYESLKYSDPMSNPALSWIEAQIEAKLSEFSRETETEKAKALSSELQKLIAERAVKCRLLK